VIKKLMIAVVAAGLLTGCGSVGGREQAAGAVAERLFSAIEAGDGGGACALLAPDTADAVARDRPCPEAILDEDLPEQPGPVTHTGVYGQRAQVQLTGDTVFLGVFPGGWRVVAAGCTARTGGRPYECVVES
jgi:hypothetical protein